MSLERLKNLRDDYSDEIPAQTLSGPVTERDRKKFKVRRNWWHGVVQELSLLFSRSLIPSNLIREAQNFIAYYTSENFYD